MFYDFTDNRHDPEKIIVNGRQTVRVFFNLNPILALFPSRFFRKL